MAEDAPSGDSAKGVNALLPLLSSWPSTQSIGDGAKSVNELLPVLSSWPPTQSTRDAVVGRLVDTLSAPSILSEKFGAIPKPEAERAAAAIEAEAFAVADVKAEAFAAASRSGTAVPPTSAMEGAQILRAYSMEVSRCLIELAKSRASSDKASAYQE